MSRPFRNVGDTLESLEISFGLDMKVFPGRGLRPLVKLLWLALDNNDLRDIGETDLYRSVFDCILRWWFLVAQWQILHIFFSFESNSGYKSIKSNSMWMFFAHCTVKNHWKENLLNIKNLFFWAHAQWLILQKMSNIKYVIILVKLFWLALDNNDLRYWRNGFV